MIDVLLTPADLAAAEPLLPDSQVIILDILRATSTIITALNAGARDLFLFDTLDAARAAKSSNAHPIPLLLAGEANCLKPADFDLGNSPREHLTEKVGGATILLSTTNGTRAAHRARAAKTLFVASLLNASATAEALLPNLDHGPTLFICAGNATPGGGGKLALEDALGAGAILFALMQTTYRADLPFSDAAWLAYHAFSGVRTHLGAALRLGTGALNIIDAGLEDDIDHCAKLDAMPLIATINPQTLRVIRS